MEGIPKDMPALAYAQLMQDRVGRAGFEWDDISGALDKLAEEIGELKNSKNDKERAEEYGDVLFMVVSHGPMAGPPGRGLPAPVQPQVPETVHGYGGNGRQTGAWTSQHCP